MIHSYLYSSPVESVLFISCSIGIVLFTSPPPASCLLPPSLWNLLFVFVNNKHNPQHTHCLVNLNGVLKFWYVPLTGNYLSSIERKLSEADIDDMTASISRLHCDQSHRYVASFGWCQPGISSSFLSFNFVGISNANEHQLAVMAVSQMMSDPHVGSFDDMLLVPSPKTTLVWDLLVKRSGFDFGR